MVKFKVNKFISAFGILSPKAKQRMFFLLPIILVGMLLETLSVGMVIPALGILMSESYFEEIPVLLPYLENLGNPSHQQLIVFGLSGLAVVFLLKNLFLFFQVQCQGTFVYSSQREIAMELFRLYLSKGYKFHLQNNSAKLIRNLTTEIVSYCSFFLNALSQYTHRVIGHNSNFSLTSLGGDNGHNIFRTNFGIIDFFVCKSN